MLRRAKTALVYSASGVGKTNQLFRLCKYLLAEEWKTNPKAKARLIHADGGGWTPFEDSGYIENGHVIPFDITKREEALADIKRLGDGYWPVEKQGVVTFAGEQRCKLKPVDYEEAPFLFIEGITSIANQWLDYMADQEAGMGFKHSWVIKEAEYTIGGLQEGHYGIVQKEIHKLITQGFNQLPYKWIVWSALAAKSEDLNTRVFKYAPEVAGRAVNHKVPSWLGTTFFMEPRMVRIGDTDTRIIAAHFEESVATDGIPFVAKSRVLEGNYGELKRYFPHGYVPCIAGQRGIESYWKVVDILNKKG